MNRGLLVFVATLVTAIAVGCGRREGPPPPPESPDWTGRVPSKPPGADDYARRSFASPLSRRDAETILRHTRLLEFGGMPPKRQVQAFNVVFEQPDAVSRFGLLADAASQAGQLYAFAALLLLDPTAADRLRGMLAEASETILIFDSDVVYEGPVAETAAMIERRNLGAWFRRVRDETNAHYSKSQ
jgi:hypothetical protein